jgi:endogenous inhibitor of DNA gyrase (YacG/DUF329 family)
LTGFVGRQYDPTTMIYQTRAPQAHHARPVSDQVSCPTCRTKTAWHGNAQRPFCSLTCRLIDLGQWLDERYQIAPRADDDVS